ncbi:MAG: hypothetical protein AABY77_07740 [Nitrospirota bacterium]
MARLTPHRTPRFARLPTLFTDPFIRLGKIVRSVDVEKRAESGVRHCEGGLGDPMHPKLRAIAKILDLESARLDKGSKERQACLRVHGMQGLERTLHIRDYDVAGAGLVKNDPDGLRIDPWHITGGGEDSLAGSVVQPRIQAAESSPAGNEVHDNPDSQNLEWLNRVSHDQDLVEDAPVRIQDSLHAGAPADIKKPLVDAEPAAFSSCQD